MPGTQSVRVIQVQNQPSSLPSVWGNTRDNNSLWTADAKNGSRHNDWGLALVERHHRVCKTLIKPHITVLRTLLYSAMPSVDDGGIRWINCFLKQDGLVTNTVDTSKSDNYQGNSSIKQIQKYIQMFPNPIRVSRKKLRKTKKEIRRKKTNKLTKEKNLSKE